MNAGQRFLNHRIMTASWNEDQWTTEWHIEESVFDLNEVSYPIVYLIIMDISVSPIRQRGRNMIVTVGLRHLIIIRLTGYKRLLSGKAGLN